MVSSRVSSVTNHPAVLAIVCLLILWLFTRFGIVLATRTAGNHVPHPSAETSSSALALTASLTLLGLLIGMTLATAAARSTQRQLTEQQEAAAIRSAYIRAQLLNPPQSAAIRGLLAQYLTSRIATYSAASAPRPSDPETAAFPPRLWQVVLVPTPSRRIASSTLVISSLNLVLTSRAYARRAWSTRIPATDWLLLILLAALASLLAGFALPPAPTAKRSRFLILLPTLIAASFFLIDALDLSAAGFIRPHAHALQTLATDLPRLP